MSATEGPIGILDSGVGGLSVLAPLRLLLPGEDLLYFADQAHIPYGPRPAEEVRRFTVEIIRLLLARGAKLVVVACNAASAAALDHARAVFPNLPIVGMEPAVKPAALATRSGAVGVLATPGTFNSSRYAGLMARYAGDIRVYENPCRGLVELIEAGMLDSAAARELLADAVEPMLAEGVDTLVLGCTHYPFVSPLLRDITGGAITIVDPAPAVARQAVNVLTEKGLLRRAGQAGNLRCVTTGDSKQFGALAARLLGYPCEVEMAYWRDRERLAGAVEVDESSVEAG